VGATAMGGATVTVAGMAGGAKLVGRPTGTDGRTGIAGATSPTPAPRCFQAPPRSATRTGPPPQGPRPGRVRGRGLGRDCGAACWRPCTPPDGSRQGPAVASRPLVVPSHLLAIPAPLTIDGSQRFATSR